MIKDEEEVDEDKEGVEADYDGVLHTDVSVVCYSVPLVIKTSLGMLVTLAMVMYVCLNGGNDIKFSCDINGFLCLIYLIMSPPVL